MGEFFPCFKTGWISSVIQCTLWNYQFSRTKTWYFRIL